MTEFYFDTHEDLEKTLAWAASPEGQCLAIDEAEFMDRSSMRTYIAEEAGSIRG